MPTNTEETGTEEGREQALHERFREIEAKYTEEGIVHLGDATPEELRELSKLTRELLELRAVHPEVSA